MGLADLYFLVNIIAVVLIGLIRPLFLHQFWMISKTSSVHSLRMERKFPLVTMVTSFALP